MPAVSKSQQSLFALVRNYQRNQTRKASGKIKSIAAHISPTDAEHFAKTKRTGLPMHTTKQVMNKQAFDRGFIKAALAVGVNPLQAVSLLKQAGGIGDFITNPANAQLVGGLGGAAVGGVGGAMMGGKNKLRNGLLGAASGGVIGALGGGYLNPAKPAGPREMQGPSASIDQALSGSNKGPKSPTGPLGSFLTSANKTQIPASGVEQGLGGPNPAVDPNKLHKSYKGLLQQSVDDSQTGGFGPSEGSPINNELIAKMLQNSELQHKLHSLQSMPEQVGPLGAMGNAAYNMFDTGANAVGKATDKAFTGIQSGLGAAKDKYLNVGEDLYGGMPAQQ